MEMAAKEVGESRGRSALRRAERPFPGLSRTFRGYGSIRNLGYVYDQHRGAIRNSITHHMLNCCLGGVL